MSTSKDRRLFVGKGCRSCTSDSSAACAFTGVDDGSLCRRKVLCDKPAELLGQYHAFLLDASVRVPETKNAVFWFFFVNAFAARLEADDDQPFSQFVRRNRRVKKHYASFNEASNARIVRDAYVWMDYTSIPQRHAMDHSGRHSFRLEHPSEQEVSADLLEHLLQRCFGGGIAAEDGVDTGRGGPEYLVGGGGRLCSAAGGRQFRGGGLCSSP